MAVITKTCSCGAVTKITVADTDFRNYKSAHVTVGKAFPYLNPFERETMITGMCFKCQSETFNKPMPGEDWGECLGECELCGAPLWAKDYDSGVCPCYQNGLGDEC